MNRRRPLHVASGTSTTRLIRAARIPGARSIWADPLHEGPVPALLPDASLVELRMRYLRRRRDIAAVLPDWTRAVRRRANDMRRWREVIADVSSYDELVLWFEHDLFDQLNLVQLLSWIRERGFDARPVTLICIGSHPGHPSFKGLGELAADEMASLFPTRTAVTDAQYRLASRVWDAFRQPTPEPLDALRTTDTSALPYVNAALTRFLQEYPWRGDGLSRTERRLLQVCGDVAVPLVEVLPRMHAGERAYYVTDATLAGLSWSLSRQSPPLLTWAPAGPGAANPLDGVVQLTDTGRATLAGEVDRVRLCGIDRWLGGVHLQGGRDDWRWNEERHRVTR